MKEGRESAWHVATAPHTAVIITRSLLQTSLMPEAWVPRLGGRRQAGDELRSSRSPWLTQAEEVPGKVFAFCSA